MFNIAEEMLRQKRHKERLLAKKINVRGVKYVSTDNSLASPLNQYYEYVKY